MEGGGFESFFDLESDPYEMHNIIHTVDRATLAHFRSRLAVLGNCTERSCW